jgi:hypothetical protein
LVIWRSGVWIFKFPHAFNPGPGSEVGDFFERCDVFGTAVRVPAVIDGIDPDENISIFLHLSTG